MKIASMGGEVKEQTTTDQEEYKISSYIYQITSWWSPRIYANILWTDEIEAEFGRFRSHYIYKKLTQH